FFSCWVSLALSLLAPWIVRVLTAPAFYPGSRVVPVLAFGATAFIAFNVMSIGIGRAKRTQFNWVVTGIAAAVNLGLNFALIPPYGMMGAAVATLVAYTVMFLGMTVRAQQVFPVPYQWRRVAIVAAAAAGLTVLGKAPGDEEPDQADEPGHSRLGGDGDRRVVRSRGFRLLAPQVLLLPVGVLEAPDADPDHGMLDG